MRLLSALFCVLAIVACSIPRKQCLVHRAALDIGSGSTKLVVAQVDHCENKIANILLEESSPVPYKEDLLNSVDSTFSKEIRRQGLKALNDFARKVKGIASMEMVGVATAAFRQAQNGMEFLKTVEEKTGIKISTIFQEREGLLGFWAAKDKSGIPADELLVWDVGGGSMQLTSLSQSIDLPDLKTGQAKENLVLWERADKSHLLADRKFLHYYDVFLGGLASVSFKDLIIKKVQKKNSEKFNSPNPLTKENREKALKLVHSYVKDQVLPPLKDIISRKKVMGIGGVHYYSIRKQTIKNDRDYFTPKDIREALKQRLGLTDGEIGGDYASTEVSNLILILGFMEALSIQKVYPLKVNMAHGILLDPAFWQDPTASTQALE